MIRKRALAYLCLVGSLISLGCATVNPQEDYQRASQHIATATGLTGSDPTQDDELTSKLVDDLLRDGISADQAVQICLLNNPELRAAFWNVGIARADVVQAGLFSNPSLGMSLQLPSGGGLSNFQATLAQNLVDLWQIPIRKRAAQRGLDRTILEVGALAARLAAEAKAAYHTAIGADRRLDIARENLELTNKVLELTEMRRDAGAGSALDVNLARGVVLETELAVQQLRLAASTARRRLAGTLGLTLDADTLTLTESLPDPPTHELLTESLVQTALELRLDVRAVRTAILAAEDRLVLQYRRVFPSVSIGLALERAERGRSSSRDVLADTARSSIAGGRLTAPEIQPRSARRKNTDLIIGPSLSLALPIFDQNQAQIARARFELQQGRRVLQGLERAIRQDVRGAVDRARTAWQIARFYRNQVVPQAQKSLDMSRQSYHAGRASILSVLDAERSFLSARDRYAQALQVAAASVPALERAIGLPMERLLSLDDAEQPLPAAIQPSSDAATPPDETVDEEPESNDGAEL